MTPSLLKLIKKAGLALVASLLIVSVVSADFSISPGTRNRSMRFQIEAGKTQTGTVFIRNTGLEPLTVRIYASDGKRTSSGNYAVKSGTDEQLGLGAWTSFKQEVYTLKAQEDREVQFTVKLPQDIPPGVYAGGIAIEKGSTEEEASGGAMAVKVNTRVVSPFFVDVPGQKSTDVSFDTFEEKISSKNEHFFNLSVTNNGNTAIVAKTKVFIEGWFGLYKEELTSEDLYLYRGDQTQFQINWPNIPIAGVFSAKAQIEYYENNIVEDSTTFVDSLGKEISLSIIPWTYIGLLLGLLLALFGFITGKKHRMNKIIKNSQSYNIQPGDTITSIAQKFSVDWKLIAKINGLKEPYSLEGKKQILIPPKK